MGLVVPGRNIQSSGSCCFPEILKSVPGIKEAKMLYRGTRDGFDGKNFHKRCDNKGSTLIIARSDHNRVFGAFTDIPWTSPKQRKQVEGKGNSFLFTIDKGKMIKLKCLKPE